MENAQKTLAELIEQRLKALNTNAFAVEKEHGLPPDAIRSVLRGLKKSGTGLNNAQQICEALGLELYIGPPRDTGPVEQVILDGQEFAQVPLHKASLAAGHGADNGTETIVDHLAFRRDWLKRIGVAASKAVLARAQGDSMQPSIHDGDLVLIDTSRREISIRSRTPSDQRPAPIYALLDGGGARVKRLEQPEPGIIMLLSDNPAFPPEILTGPKAAALNIIGKVMWWGHTNRD